MEDLRLGQKDQEFNGNKCSGVSGVSKVVATNEKNNGCADIDKELQNPAEAPVAQGGILRTISNTLSRTSTIDPGPPPDGGLQAWTQALMGHLVVFNTWGYINSFGVFQTYYVSALNQTPSAISWLGSIQIFLLFAIGSVSG